MLNFNNNFFFSFTCAVPHRVQVTFCPAQVVKNVASQGLSKVSLALPIRTYAGKNYHRHEIE